jgi:hypothetical protein
MKDFEGWEPRAARGDVRFDLKYARKIEPVARVVDRVLGEMADQAAFMFCHRGRKVFQPVTELAAAASWIRAG